MNIFDDTNLFCSVYIKYHIRSVRLDCASYGCDIHCVGMLVGKRLILVHQTMHKNP